MKKKILVVLSTVLVSLVMAALFSGCTQTVAGGSDIVDIQRFRQTTSGLEITNYQVVFKQTPDEWNALSKEDKQKLAQAGFDAAIQKMKDDGVSNYNVTAQTVPGKLADGTERSQLAFFLNREDSLLQIYSNPDADGKPEIVDEVPITLP